MELVMEKVTPTKAEGWLNKNKSNRKLRDGVVERYAEDMRNGQWTTCPVPICFYNDGDVADGQHRLWAIVESGCPQTFPVARGLTRADGLNIDTGLNRSIVDNARISGQDAGLSNQLLSVARAIAEGERGGAKPLSNAQRLALVESHRDAAKWACANGPKGRWVNNAITVGAVARAWYVEKDHERLRRFCDVLGSGFSDGESESAAIAIRNYLVNKGTVTTSAGLWRDTFLKVQNAIRYFMLGKKLTVIKQVSEEAYPLRKSKKASQ
jgi:hypothetical protein